MDLFFNTLYALFLDALYILTSNVVVIVCSLVAWSRAKKGKSAKGWFAAGIVIQGISVLGSILGMVRNPELWVSYDRVINVVVFFAVILVFGVLIHKVGKRGKEE